MLSKLATESLAYILHLRLWYNTQYVYLVRTQLCAVYMANQNVVVTLAGEQVNDFNLNQLAVNVNR